METLEPRKWASPSSPQVHNKAHLPSGESPYAQAKRVQLLDKNPSKAISLFWAAINNRDRVDSALKDMAMVMKQVSRPEEAIEAIRSFRNLCSIQAQDSLDNVLLDLYKKCGRVNDQIELLSLKLKLMDEGLCLGRGTVKMGRFPAQKFCVSEDQEKARLLGNLAWAYMQSENYNEAELIYRRALEIEPDNNRQCNLSICLIKTGRIEEAKNLLQGVNKSSIRCKTESFSKSLKKASEMLMEIEEKDKSLNCKFQNASFHGMKTNGISKNVSPCDLSDGMSSASPDGRHQVEFSPVSSGNTPTNHVSPLSSFTGHDQDSKRMNSTQEASFTPKKLNSCSKLESKEQSTCQRSSESIRENFESFVKHRTTSYWKSSSNHARKDVAAEDTTSKPATSPVLSKNLTAKALRKSANRQTQGRKKQNNLSESLAKCSGRSIKVYHEKIKCVIREDAQMTKELTQSRKTLHDGETDSCLKNSTNENLDQSFETSGEGNLKNNGKEEITVNTVQMTANVDSARNPAIFGNGRSSCVGQSAHDTLHGRETDSYLENSTNENLDQSFETSVEGNLKNNIKEKRTISTVQMSDNVDSAKKPAILNKERSQCAGHSTECYQTKFDVLTPGTPTTNTTTTTVSEQTEELNAGGSITDKTMLKPKNRRKTWADMVEEEEQEECLNNENENNETCNSGKEEQTFKSLVAQWRWTESEAFAGEAMNTILSDSGPDIKLLLSKNYTDFFGDKGESQSRRGMGKRRDGSARRCLSFGQPPFLYDIISEPKNKRPSRLKVFQEITRGDSPRQC